MVNRVCSARPLRGAEYYRLLNGLVEVVYNTTCRHIRYRNETIEHIVDKIKLHLLRRKYYPENSP